MVFARQGKKNESDPFFSIVGNLTDKQTNLQKSINCYFVKLYAVFQYTNHFG